MSPVFRYAMSPVSPLYYVPRIAPLYWSPFAILALFIGSIDHRIRPVP